MKNSQKEILFKDFQCHWKKQFQKIPSIIRYLSSYDDITTKLDTFLPLNFSNLRNSQLEWVSLVSQFDNLIEADFFKPYWIPIQKNKYDYFIDLSSECLPLFKVDFFFYEPYRWYKKYIAKDLSQFLIDIDNANFNIDDYLREVEGKEATQLSGFFEERDELGFSSKLELYPIDKHSLFGD
ncbi:hypothetical protein N9E30_00715 [Flavobacteriales bacterium]|nr:hypothetical protein [Flavobacteriales bacterium]MDB2362273.1 hypothetical protein [Flavobacteriales bacterium]